MDPRFDAHGEVYCAHCPLFHPLFYKNASCIKWLSDHQLKCPTAADLAVLAKEEDHE